MALTTKLFLLLLSTLAAVSAAPSHSTSSELFKRASDLSVDGYLQARCARSIAERNLGKRALTTVTQVATRTSTVLATSTSVATATNYVSTTTLTVNVPSYTGTTTSTTTLTIQRYTPDARRAKRNADRRAIDDIFNELQNRDLAALHIMCRDLPKYEAGALEARAPTTTVTATSYTTQTVTSTVVQATTTTRSVVSLSVTYTTTRVVKTISPTATVVVNAGTIKAEPYVSCPTFSGYRFFWNIVSGGYNQCTYSKIDSSTANDQNPNSFQCNYSATNGTIRAGAYNNARCPSSIPQSTKTGSGCVGSYACVPAFPGYAVDLNRSYRSLRQLNATAPVEMYLTCISANNKGNDYICEYDSTTGSGRPVNNGSGCTPSLEKPLPSSDYTFCQLPN